MSTTHKIEKLTPEQEKEVEVWKERWLAIGRATQTDRPDITENQKLAEKALIALYADLGFAPPNFIHVESPKQMCSLPEIVKSMKAKGGDDWKTVTYETLMKSFEKMGKEIDKAKYNENLNNSWFIQWWSGWRVFYLFCEEVLGIKYDPADSKKLHIWIELCRNVHAFLAYDTHCFVSAYPTHLSWDTRNRLHAEDGPALAYSDGQEVYASGGIRIKEPKMIDLLFVNPQKITAKDVSTEQNQEIKSLLLKKMGWPKYLKQVDAKLVHTEEGYGELLSVKIPGTTTDGLFYKAMNSTPEPDGSVKEYILQCDPNLRPMKFKPDGTIEFGKPQEKTARNAAASLFGLRGEEYHPLVES